MHTKTALLVSLLWALGCERTPPAQETLAVAAPAPTAHGTQGTTASEAHAAVAAVGSPAPAFTLPDLHGRPVSLSDFAGKRVVLEWFNPKCPFVRASHTKGSLVDAAERARADGVVWLAINSGAPGQQGHGAPANQEGAKTFGLNHPVLLDEDGSVGRKYGALKTPHLFVIDEHGVLVYAGAVDNSPDGEGESPEGGQLVRYVDRALAELESHRPVSVAMTKPYGCSVKYAPK